MEERLGRGADEVWIFRPSGPPQSIVVFVHGLGLGETTPVNHRPWLEHLARQGSAVIYPRYERTLGSRLAVRHLLVGVRLAFRRLGSPKLPLVAIGYSRGGELVADYTAVARLAGPVPAEVLNVFNQFQLCGCGDSVWPCGSRARLHEASDAGSTNVPSARESRRPRRTDRPQALGAPPWISAALSSRRR